MSQSLKDYELVETEDGSNTLFSKAFGEACHSTSGARDETKLHYLLGCEIEKKSLQKSITILEVGFGTGLGMQMTVELLKNSPGYHQFISMELDPDLVTYFFQQNYIEHKWKNESGYKIVEGSWHNTHFKIIIGNARISLPKFIQANNFRWDAIYQDAFSPKRNPVLWTKEWFELLKTYASPDVILSTYSASSSIRKSLHEAGWTIQNGEKFGPKKSSTRARLEGATAEEILDAMKRSPAKAILDADLPLELLQ